MTSIKRAPLVKCDVCGLEAEKVEHHSSDYTRPEGWGYMNIGGRNPYEPVKLSIPDMCPGCIQQALGFIKAWAHPQDVGET